MRERGEGERYNARERGRETLREGGGAVSRTDKQTDRYMYRRGEGERYNEREIQRARDRGEREIQRERDTNERGEREKEREIQHENDIRYAILSL